MAKSNLSVFKYNLSNLIFNYFSALQTYFCENWDSKNLTKDISKSLKITLSKKFRYESLQKSNQSIRMYIQKTQYLYLQTDNKNIRI